MLVNIKLKDACPETLLDACLSQYGELDYIHVTLIFYNNPV